METSARVIAGVATCGFKRACSHGGGGPREGEVPRLPWWGNQSLHTISFSLDRVHMRGGVPYRGGLTGQPGQVTRLAGVSFLHVNAEGGT